MPNTPNAAIDTIRHNESCLRRDQARTSSCMSDSLIVMQCLERVEPAPFTAG